MKGNELRESAHDQPISQADREAANDSVSETELQLFQVTADYYERRWKHRITDDRHDWWIATAVYLIMVGVAFVAL